MKTFRLKSFFLIGAALFFVCSLYFIRVQKKFFPPAMNEAVAFHHDEYDFCFLAYRIAVTGNLNPGCYYHPGSTLIYPLAAVYAIFDRPASGSHIIGKSIKDPYRKHPRNNPYFFSKAARFFGIAMGMLALIAVFFLLFLNFGILFAFIGTLILSIDKLFFNLAHTIRNDGTSVLFVTMTLIALFFCRKTFSNKRHLIFGLSLAAAFVTKYYLGFVGILYWVLLVESYWQGIRQNWSSLAWNVGSALLGFLLGITLFHPYLILDYPAVYEDVILQVGFSSPTRPLLTFSEQLAYFLRETHKSMGTLLLLLAVGGSAHCVLRKNIFAVGSLLAVVFYYLLISSTNAYYERWLLPVFPILILLMLFGLRALCDATAAYIRSHKSSSLIALRDEI